MAQASWSEIVSGLNQETTESSRIAFERGESVGARQFVWEPLRTYWQTWRAPPAGGSSVTDPVLAGYRAMLHAAKLWEVEERWRSESAVTFSARGRRCLARRGWREAVMLALDPEVEHVALTGGRGGTSSVATPRGRVVLRPYRRGGAVRWLGDTHLGFRPRPFREFWTLLSAWRRGLPVVEPVAAMVERRVGPAYRGWLVTVAAENHEPLSTWMHGHAIATATPALASSLRRIHAAGLRHPDLSLGNLLVGSDAVGGGPSFLFLDFDRAHLDGRPLGVAGRRSALRRLRRSARKLDPGGTAFPDAELDRLESLYWSQSDS